MEGARRILGETDGPGRPGGPVRSDTAGLRRTL